MELMKNNENRNIIEKVIKGSIAEELQIKPKDILLSINNSEVKDIIDYKFLISDEYVVVEIEKENNDIWELEIEKEFDEDLGIEFTNPLIDRAKSCRNNCIFCFIDQLPPNMRETLYFKDDDSRLSFLQGNFITLTNMSDEDIDRIIAYRLTPVNVSVHTTNPELRIKMLNNKNAGKLFPILQRFKKAGLEINCQIVLLPGVNDDKELERTLKDLSTLYPSVQSVAIVPVGITKYRKDLYKTKPFDRKKSEEFLTLVEKQQADFMESLGTRFVFPSDEFYAVANKAIPSYEEYEGFPQIENGVGLMKSFEAEVEEELNNIKDPITLNKNYIIATGRLAENFMNTIKDKVINKFHDLKLDVVPIENNFFGKTITVSGLITGIDLINQLKTYEDIDGVIIPESMLRYNSNVFLDDITIENIENQLKVEIIPVEVSGKEFIDLFIKGRGGKNG